MDLMRAMKVFVRVVDEGGFAKAARALDLAPPAVTRIVADLESHLNARLLNRTTRSIALTEVGEAYLEKVRNILVEVEESQALADEGTREPRGHLRVLCPPSVAVHQLAKHLPQFSARHPQVSIELHSPGPVETVDESYDLTIIAARKPIQGDFVAKVLARSEVVTCASPEYLDRRGRPGHPRELASHDALVPPISELQRGLTFVRGAGGSDDPQAETYTVVADRRPTLSSSHIDTMYAAALSGLGIAGLPSFVIEDALMENALERVLPEWRLFDTRLWVAMPSRKHVPARTRVFIDFLLGIFGGADDDPWLRAAGCATRPRGP